jgi:hypothetical protein
MSGELWHSMPKQPHLEDLTHLVYEILEGGESCTDLGSWNGHHEKSSFDSITGSISSFAKSTASHVETGYKSTASHVEKGYKSTSEHVSKGYHAAGKGMNDAFNATEKGIADGWDKTHH